MKLLDTFIEWFVGSVLFWLPPMLGGAVDYLNQVSKGQKKRSFKGFFMHILSALFFGWVCGRIAAGLGYEADLIYAAAGLGGFFGVRVADLLTHLVERTRNK